MEILCSVTTLVNYNQLLVTWNNIWCLYTQLVDVIMYRAQMWKAKRELLTLEVLPSYGDHDSLSTFTEPRSMPEDIANVGAWFFLKLYGDVRSTSLDTLRYIFYTRSISRSSLSSVVKLESLPPTVAAAKFHPYRAYLAVNQWIGNNLWPNDWRWQYRDGSLVQLTTDRPVAPTRVLRIVSCGCKTGCQNTCGWRKAGVYCSPMCSHCNGQTCSNIHVLAISQDSDNDS